MKQALKAGYSAEGASIGSRLGDAELFCTEMIAFWQCELLMSAASCNHASP